MLRGYSRELTKIMGHREEGTDVAILQVSPSFLLRVPILWKLALGSPVRSPPRFARRDDNYAELVPHIGCAAKRGGGETRNDAKKSRHRY